eukprot:704296_1
MTSNAPKTRILVQKTPGKLKFNPAMFNPWMMKPGAIAKNKKLEELRQKRQAGAPKALQTTEDFSRPTAPRRHGKSHKPDLVEEIKEDAQNADTFYNQSLIAADDTNSSQNTSDTVNQVLKDAIANRSTVKELENRFMGEKETQKQITLTQFTKPSP